MRAYMVSIIQPSWISVDHLCVPCLTVEASCLPTYLNFWCSGSILQMIFLHSTLLDHPAPYLFICLCLIFSYFQLSKCAWMPSFYITKEECLYLSYSCIQLHIVALLSLTFFIKSLLATLAVQGVCIILPKHHASAACKFFLNLVIHIQMLS